MSRKVLNVGQCDFDHGRIKYILEQQFDVEVVRANSHDEGIKGAQDQSYDLVLVNRLLDLDGSPGMDVLRSLKSLPATSEVPVMLVSNYSDAQDAAVAEGAVMGFGKATLDSEETIQLLGEYLAD